MTSLPKAPNADCANCPYVDNPFVPSYVPDTLDAGERILVAMISDKPERADSTKGKPFSGTGGRIVSKMWERMEIDPREVAIVNTVSCVPRGGDKFFARAQECCSGRLFTELEELNPRKIAIMGKEARDVILPQYKDALITKVRGKLLYSEESDQQLLPTWHPRYVLRRNSEAPVLYNDLKFLLSSTGDGVDDRFRNEPVVTTPQTATEAIMLLRSIPAGPVAVDIESTGVEWYPRGTNDYDPNRLVMIAIAWQYGSGITIPATLLDQEMAVWFAMEDFFARTDIEFIAHNGKFDTTFLNAHFDLWLRVDFDTMLAHHCLDEAPPHGLKPLAQIEFNIADYEERIIAEYLVNRNDDYGKIPYDKFALYAVWDVCVTLGLYHLYRERMLAESSGRSDGSTLLEWPFKNVYMRAHHLLTKAELYGFYVDREYLVKQGELMQTEMASIEKEMAITIGFEVNPRSSKQMGVALYDVLGYQIPRNKVGNGRNKVKERSTSKEAVKYLLERYGNTDFLVILKKYRRVAKIYSSYVKNLALRISPISRVHATFNIHGTATGRLSVKDPALQTIPRGGDKYGKIIKGAFGAGPGRALCGADYSQAELVVAGALSNSTFLKMVYEEERDLHHEVKVRIFGEDGDDDGINKEHRNVAKMANFSQLYGKDPNALRSDDRMNISMQDAMNILAEYNSMMPELSSWKVAQGPAAARKGFSQSVFGRKRRYKVVSDQTMNDINKAAINQPVQGAASDLTLLAACNLQDELDELDIDAHVVLLVHDSIIVDSEESIADEVLQMMGKHMVQLAYDVFPNMPWKADGEVTKYWSPRDTDPPHDTYVWRNFKGEITTVAK